MPTTLYKFGALATDTPQQILQFQAFFALATDAVSHFRLPFTTTPYQVTPGKTLYIVQFADDGTNNPAYFKFGYCDNDLGFGTGTARVNPVMSVGLDNGNQDNGFAVYGTDTNQGDDLRNIENDNSIIKVAIGGKYPFVRRVSFVAGATILMWGIEL